MRNVVLALAAAISLLFVPAGSARAENDCFGYKDWRSQEYASFQGSWVGHGRYMFNEAMGCGTITNRTYRWCYQGPPPCDTVTSSGYIIGGARVHLVFVGWLDGDTVLAQQVVLDGTTVLVPGGQVILKKLGPHIIEVSGFGWYCAPQALGVLIPADTCGV